MSTPSAPQPEKPSGSGTNGSADDDAPAGRPDRQEDSGQADDDGYEPL